MGKFVIEPDILFQWADVLFAFFFLAVSVYLFLRHKPGYITPILFMGLFLFPLQFSIWFVPAQRLSGAFGINLLETLYLLFVKVCLLFALLLSRR
ncbi:MAG: hypothetical protein JXQ30_15790 [Spirochaetes bacterium]|nr:hypothetical protein [Spirochaetota bacterium]